MVAAKSVVNEASMHGYRADYYMYLARDLLDLVLASSSTSSQT